MAQEDSGNRTMEIVKTIFENLFAYSHFFILALMLQSAQHYH
jgi:hypothetical protein